MELKEQLYTLLDIQKEQFELKMDKRYCIQRINTLLVEYLKSYDFFRCNTYLKDQDLIIETVFKNKKELQKAINELNLFHDHYDLITNELICESDSSNDKIITRLSLNKETIDYLFPKED